LVWEHVVAVTPALHDAEWRVKRHPVQQVGHLAQAAADAHVEMARFENEAVDEPATPCRRTDVPQEGEELPGTHNETIQGRRSEPKVDDLVPLQLQIQSQQGPDERGRVCSHDVRKRRRTT